MDGPPWEHFAWLRANAPVYDHPLDDPLLVERCWVVSRHEDVRAISRDPATFSSADGIHLRRAASHHFRPNMINMDDPDHARVRKLVSGGFTPRVVRAFEQHYADLAAGVVDRALAGGGTFDGVKDLAAELPLLAICEVLGAPEEDRFRIFGWSNTLLSSEDPDYAPTPEAFQSAVMAMVGYAGELAERRRREPGDDLVSALLGPDGQLPLTDAEFEGLVMLLLAAGNETTRNAIAHGLLAFADHPDQWAALRADLAGHARHRRRGDHPLGQPGELHGPAPPRPTSSSTASSIRKGDKVTLLYASANRDDSVVRRPGPLRRPPRPQPPPGLRLRPPLLPRRQPGPHRAEGPPRGPRPPGRHIGADRPRPPCPLQLPQRPEGPPPPLHRSLRPVNGLSGNSSRRTGLSKHQ